MTIHSFLYKNNYLLNYASKKNYRATVFELLGSNIKLTLDILRVSIHCLTYIGTLMYRYYVEN